MSIVDKMSKTQVNLKLIPDVDGSLAIAQLVVEIQVGGDVAVLTAEQRWDHDARLG